MARLGWDIHSARISTTGDRAREAMFNSLGTMTDLRGDIWTESRGAFQFMAYTAPNSPIPDQMNGSMKPSASA